MLNVMKYEFIGCDSDFKEADTVIFGAPFEGTVSYRSGTRMAPNAIRSSSYGFETYSPYLDQDLTECRIHDAGDLDLPLGNTPKIMNLIEETAAQIATSGKKMLMTGGEHLITFPAVKALHQVYPDLCVIHFDAHTDLRDTFFGEHLSHATVIRRVWDILGDHRIWQFGIRSGSREEFSWSAAGHTTMEKFSVNRVAEAVQAIGNRPVYLTVDLDVLDPSVLPGTGTPEPGGVSFKELHNALLLLKDLNIVGADAVELSPPYDHSDASTVVAYKIVREILLMMNPS